MLLLLLIKNITEIGSDEEVFYRKKIRSTFLNKLDANFNCSIIWDTENLLGEKMSPTDAGKEIFEKLWKKKQDSLILTFHKSSIQ